MESRTPKRAPKYRDNCLYVPLGYEQVRLVRRATIVLSIAGYRSSGEPSFTKNTLGFSHA